MRQLPFRNSCGNLATFAAIRFVFGEQLGRRSPAGLSSRMRWFVKQLELSGQHRDTQIRLIVREVRFKCVELVSGFRQALERCSLLGPSLAGWQSWGPIF